MDLWVDLLRFGFRLLYHEMAFTYDTVSWIVSLGEWQAWQRAALKHLNVAPGARVLELAHGTGNLQLDLHAAGFDAVGLDFSPEMGRIARRKLTRQRLPYKMARGRAQSLPFPDSSFPVIVSTFPTEFIVHPATIAEAYRVLTPGGRLVFVSSGVMTRTGLAQQIIEAAYQVTGQRGAWPAQIGDRFRTAGFALSQVLEMCQNSQAQVVIAEKRGST